MYNILPIIHCILLIIRQVLVIIH